MNQIPKVLERVPARALHCEVATIASSNGMTSMTEFLEKCHEDELKTSFDVLGMFT